MDIKETVVDFIVSNFTKARELKTFDNVSLLEEEIIDSVGVLELVVFLEETFGFEIEDDEIIPENLDSVSKLAVFVQSKLASNIF